MSFVCSSKRPGKTTRANRSRTSLKKFVDASLFLGLEYFKKLVPNLDIKEVLSRVADGFLDHITSIPPKKDDPE